MIFFALFFAISICLNPILMSPKPKSLALRSSAIRSITSSPSMEGTSGNSNNPSPASSSYGAYDSFDSLNDLEIASTEENLSKSSTILNPRPVQSENESLFSPIRSIKERRGLNVVTTSPQVSSNSPGSYSSLARFAIVSNSFSLKDLMEYINNEDGEDTLKLEDVEDTSIGYAYLEDDSLINFINSEGFPSKKKNN